MTYTATAYFMLEPKQGPTVCAQCGGTGKLLTARHMGGALAAGSDENAACGMCGGTGKVEAAWNPNKIYRYAGCLAMPEGGYYNLSFPGSVQYVAETARCSDMMSAMAWLHSWVGKTIERQS